MDQQTYTAQVVRRPNADELAAWYEKRGLSPDENGIFSELPYRGEDPAVEREQILENVRINAARRDVPNLAPREYTPRTLVYVGGGTTLQQFLDDVKRKCEDDNYDVLCSNKTCKWLLSKVLPKVYGDKTMLEHSGPDGGPIETHDDRQLARAILDILGKAVTPGK